MQPPKALSIGEFALRVAARPGRGDWFILLSPTGRSTATAEILKEELSALEAANIELAVNPKGATELARSSKDTKTSVLLVAGLESFSDGEWRHMDLLRSQFEREAAIILVMEPSAAARLQHSAPNLMSWIGSSVWTLALDAESLSAEEREQRLQLLRQRTNLTDQQVLDLAARKQLPADPIYAEWLVLLNRGDLLDA